MATGESGRSNFNARNREHVSSSEVFDSGPPQANGSLTELANYLNTGYWAWSGYQGTQPRHWAPGATVTFNVQDLTAAQRDLARAALSLWDDVANINFSEVTSGGQIVFNNDGSGEAFATHTVSGTSLTASTVRISSNWNGGTTAFNSYTYQTYIHEIGHALGLGHQGAYNGSATYGVDNLWDNDSWRLSVMSYFDQSEAGQGSFAYVTGPQMADIRAMIDIYGARTTTRTGDTVYGYNGTAGTSYNFTALGGVSSFTIYDNGGIDTIDGSGYGGAQTFDLRGGINNHSSVGGATNNIGIWVDTIVENARGGTGADTFYGNSANNTFFGGGAGGADVYFGDAGTDTVVFSGNLSSFSITEGNGTHTVNGPTGHTLYSIEGFQFNDTTFIDQTAGTLTDASIVVEGSGVGGIQFGGDRDWYRVTLTAGQNYVIDLRGAPTGGGTLSDPLVRLYNSAGVEVAVNDDGGHGFDSELAIRVNTSGTYYVGAGAFSSNIGTYRAEIDGLGSVATRFQQPVLELASFAPGAGGWTSNNTLPRMVGDFNGDGVQDIIGFGNSRIFVATGYNGDFNPEVGTLESFTPAAGGWTNQDLYTRAVGDINGDGRDDIVGFGATNVYISLSTGGHNFANPYADLASFGPNAGGWTSNNSYPRMLADVNGDGRDDIIGFGAGGVYVSLAKSVGTPGFNAPILASGSFGSNPSAGGWANFDQYPRTVADVNGDGRADLVGFGGSATYVALGQIDGTFASVQIGVNSFGSSAAGGGWTTFDAYPRAVRDVNNDGRADIVGFGGNFVYTSLGQPGGTFSSAVSQDLASFGLNPSAGGWSSNDLYPRMLAEISGDGRPEIIGFGSSGVYVSRDFDFVTV